MFCRLTHDVGVPMAELLPVEPQLAAALLRAGALGCASEVAAVAACLSVQRVWYGNSRSAALKAAQLRFAAAEGARPAPRM
jgi:HrpA-like RNA helicase